MKFFTPSQDPAEGLGILVLFRLIEEAVPAFFRADRRILIARAPGRLDVMGSAFCAQTGLSLQYPTAEAACAAVQERDDDLVRLWSPCRDGSRTQLLSMRLADLGLPGPGIDYDEARALLRGDPRDRWAAYLLGSLLVLARERGLVPVRGVELLLHSDVPEARGAGSSTAVVVAAMRGLALQHGVDLSAAELSALVSIVERDILRSENSLVDPIGVAAALAGEVLVVDRSALAVAERVLVPTDLEFVALDSGPRNPPTTLAPSSAGEGARVARFLELLRLEPTASHRQELGDLMFASHGELAAIGATSSNADFVVDESKRRRLAGGAVLGARMSGTGGGGTVVLCGEHTKVWYEALRIKKALLAATGHSAHVFRWSSPGALAFGAIELTPKAHGGPAG